MSSITDLGVARPAVRKSTAELVNDLTSQFSHLARVEVRLAVREVQRKARHAGIGLAGVGVAGVLALIGFAVVVTSVVLLLALVLPAWIAALIVGVALLLFAGVAALVARAQLRKGTPIPSAAVERARDDLQVVRTAARR